MNGYLYAFLIVQLDIYLLFNSSNSFCETLLYNDSLFQFEVSIFQYKFKIFKYVKKDSLFRRIGEYRTGHAQ